MEPCIKSEATKGGIHSNKKDFSQRPSGNQIQDGKVEELTRKLGIPKEGQVWRQRRSMQ